MLERSSSAKLTTPERSCPHESGAANQFMVANGADAVGLALPATAGDSPAGSPPEGTHVPHGESPVSRKSIEVCA